MCDIFIAWEQISAKWGNPTPNRAGAASNQAPSLGVPLHLLRGRVSIAAKRRHQVQQRVFRGPSKQGQQQSHAIASSSFTLKQNRNHTVHTSDCRISIGFHVATHSVVVNSHSQSLAGLLCAAVSSLPLESVPAGLNQHMRTELPLTCGWIEASIVQGRGSPTQPEHGFGIRAE